MYLVAGVSGHTGSATVETLLGRHQPVRVLVRDAAKAVPYARRGAQVAVGDLGDAPGLASALAGITGAFLLVPPPPPGTTGVIERGQRLVASMKRAIERSGVPHVVFLSSMGAELERSGAIRVLHDAERKLGELPTPITFIRAGFFIENWAASLPPVLQSGGLPTFLDPGRKLPMVATADIGATAARALTEPPARHRIVDLAGPADCSAADVAAALGNLLGKPVHLQPGPLGGVVPALAAAGCSRELAELFREMYEGINTGRIRMGGGTLVRGTTSLEQGLASILRH
jgi:uncharacterized protein YbjT (DUF2867 family)